MADRSVVTIWQWNCRGFCHKRYYLFLHLLQIDPLASLDIIVLQETHANVSLSVYVAHNQVAHDPQPHPVTVILTRRTLVVNRADMTFPALHHIFLKVLPERREQPSLFILNVYSPLRATEEASLLTLIRAAAARALKPTFLFSATSTDSPTVGISSVTTIAYAAASHTSIVLLSNTPPCLHANSGNNSARCSPLSWAANNLGISSEDATSSTLFLASRSFAGNYNEWSGPTPVTLRR
ncbi:hypothetical protein HPB51_002078 [Rhipicephalus microplus]|uniref:Tick transposon n=1 Tax=Rhipicephalus microplus TaxID=6941 RepID=A0A9J6E678_RHIMP|nr:hypothetical protein HPB51_002078 [Rhipicephalus microplus]